MGVAVNVRLVFNAGGTLNIYGVDAAEKGLAGMRVEVTTIDGTRVGTYATDTPGHHPCTWPGRRLVCGDSHQGPRWLHAL